MRMYPQIADSSDEAEDEYPSSREEGMRRRLEGKEGRILHSKNPNRGEYDADEEWHLAIGCNQCEIGSKKEKIWRTASYLRIGRGEIPDGGGNRQVGFQKWMVDVVWRNE